MERSGNFYKAIRLGYILISILIGCMAYNSLYEWQEIEALELGNKKIDELRKEINNINIQMIKFSLLGETILEWNDKDIEHYHAQRMAMDSMLCRFKATYPAERIDSVRSLLEDKERQMFQIVRLMDEQQSINKKIANQIPVIVQKSVQEQSKKPKRKGFLGIFGKKEEAKPTVTTTMHRSFNRNMRTEQQAQSRRLSVHAIAINKGLTLTIHCHKDAFVCTDKERILQIGNNLLSNAIKFTENGSVSLRADYDNGLLKLIVEDTGTGMTEEEQQRVFGAFERLSNAAAKDGFGLGLSIVQRIVTMLGGTIRLESDKGKGSRFTVEIPMQTAEELPERINQTQVHHNHTFHDVVAIDNDEVLLLMLKEMYAQEGIHCDTCTNAAELMELIRKKEYSLLLTDLNMPDINGFELLELLRTSNVGNSRDIPVIVTTASGSCGKEELIEHGFTECLFKPFSISELMEISNKCAMNAAQNEKPGFTSLLSYGNEAVMLEKLITETEKEMQSLRYAEQRKDLPELDALTHHLRSSWEILRADRPLRELYKLIHHNGTPDDKAIGNAVRAVLDKGSEIIRLAKEERKKYNNG